ncbi:restriction endonuclease subunit S [Nocardia cyriacigeorgica]|uniref:restriction endonuclease subunit S n=1 Tax=Nocardia cyriacigeorgica TaxID=135487 RepID=UPI0018958C51|nr:restriction endonuclease subunit S [Nocardia cyriacigeorgica]MBF6398517.1 restriction endonuclease subunit S [Nocardia cyriacigeorgica]MBF6403969.1 restriction endonuclease subunit S [Nocardia cyriacigeorgica]
MSLVVGIGDVPAHWRVERAKWMLARRRRPVNTDDGVVTAFRDGQVTLRTNRRTEGFTNAIQEIGYQGIRRGDLVVHGMDAFAGAIGVSDSDGKASPVVHAYRAEPHVCVQYVAYVLRTLAVNGYIQTLAKGIRERSTSFDPATLAGVELPLPTLEEQRRIADFLDAETSRIDRITVLRQRTAELIRERCDTRLDELVRGAGSAETVPAEFAALGRVPRSWKQARLRSVECEVQTGPFGSQLHADDYVDDQWPVVNPANITPKGLVADPKVTVTEEMRERLGRHVLREGDVVFGRRGELGRAAVVSARECGWLCGTGSLRLRFRTASFEPRYLHRYLQIPAVRHYFLLHAVGTTMANLNSSILLSMPLLLPSISEQRSIAAECDVVEEHSNAHAALYKQQLKLLSERRQALITAAVTGQFDVSTASGRNTTQGV